MYLPLSSRGSPVSVPPSWQANNFASGQQLLLGREVYIL